MPRSLADPLYERLLRSFPADHAYTRADWEGDAMPEPVAHFLRQLLRHHSRREARRLRRARSDWVNYDHPDMEQAVRTFFNAMEAHTQVPASEWETTLRQATHHTTAHLVRPVHVLTDFVYAEREEALRLPEILWRMNFFSSYSYLREAVHAFAKKRDLDALDRDQFERFLHRIDERITANYSADRWLRLLDPLFQIARRATGHERVPISAVETFFAEKDRSAIERRLDAYARDGHEQVGPTALHRLIEEAASAPPPDRASPSKKRSPTPPASSGPESPPSQPEPTPDDDIWGVDGTARPEGSGAAQPQSNDDESAPLWKRFQQGRPPPSSSPDSSSTDAPRTEDGSGNGTQTPLWARFRSERDERLSEAMSSPPDSAEESSSPASASAPPNGDLESLEQEALGVKNPPHRSVYVRQLFGGDRTAYKQVLRRICGADSWGQASQIIASDVFRAHKVNIYSDAAVHFTNAVESRFRQ